MYTCINKQLVEKQKPRQETDRIKTLYVVHLDEEIAETGLCLFLCLSRRLCVQRWCESLMRKHDYDTTEKKSSPTFYIEAT